MKTIIDPTSGIHADPVAQNGNVDGGLGGAPIALYAQTLSALAEGEVQNLPMKTLQLGFRTAYIVDEIRMIAYAETTTAGTRRGLAGTIAAKFETGAHAFSGGPDTATGGFAGGFVPIGSYAPRWGLANDEESYVYSGLSGGSNLFRAYARVRWPLPKPLYLSPGDMIRCSVQRHPTFDTGLGNVNVQVAYIGRVVAPGAPVPLMRQVPWVSYIQKLGSNAVASSNQEFRNPFTRPLMVQRFTHRIYQRKTSPSLSFIELFDTQQVPGIAAAYYESVLIEDSLGYQVTRDYVPVGHVFDLYRHAWTFARPIGPKEQFNVKFQRSQDPSPTEFVTNVGMVGYRDEVL